ncbi:protein-tyrosine phosphatase-like protein [Mycena alexandri]|uniref:protein-tyrosine-phosphatase n=1 Tax=Mycena alexandri TaxID=1745969 RepID=A0AAD6X0L1_9AGAR|nr:protein-tyrosine phosphatase-like protein [Mycena alexandri]
MQPRSSLAFKRDPSLLRGWDVVRDAESYDAIIDDKLFLGNLSAAESPQLLNRLGITHVLSVCPDYLKVSENLKHLSLPMLDDEHFDILEHLPTTCQFIQEALNSGGRVLIHCVMGISRSVTVVCAYLMFSQNISTAQAMRLVRARRPRGRPNYNFIRQLQVFSACNHNVSPEAPPYISWKAQQDFDEAHSLRVIDGMPILTGQLFLSFDFPSNRDHASAFLDHLGVTHIVSITPDHIISVAQDVLERHVHKHFIAPYTAKESLLLALPLLCRFVDDALQTNNSRVFLHCMDDLRGGIAICAYLMFSRQIPPAQALEILQDRIPLFDDNPTVLRHLELFEQCQYAPSQRHPLVRAWLSNTPPQVDTSSWIGGLLDKGNWLQTR